MKMADACPHCGLDLRGADSGDGPAFFAVSFLCLLAVLLVVWLEFTLAPPMWVSISAGVLVTCVGALLVLRPIKTALLICQHRYRKTTDA
jgi:uncharacterized protein (DUF983 family)